MSTLPELEEVQEDFNMGIICAQQVLAHFADRLGLTEETALRIASAFGSGMGKAEVCGCVSGSLMVLGMLHGQAALVRARKRTPFTPGAMPLPGLLPRLTAACNAGEFWGMTLPRPRAWPLSNRTIFSSKPVRRWFATPARCSKNTSRSIA